MAKFIRLWAKSGYEEKVRMTAINKDCIVIVYPVYDREDVKTILIVKFGTGEDQTYFTPDDFNSVMERLDTSMWAKQENSDET